MRELSIEEKARAYDEALKIINDYYQKIQYSSLSSASNDREVLEKAFPVLKENEDERIRKALIDYFDDVNKADENPLQNYGVHTDKAIAWLEKKGQNKFIDKAEPKFKVGDYIVNDYCMGKVIELTNDAYLLDSGQGIPFSCEHNAHLWTIKDAKDGDVLADGNDIVIFKENNYNSKDKSGCMFIYCSCNNFYEIGGINPTFYKPATKEQRDKLEKAMVDAGYAFDFEKKELKKLEQKQVINYSDNLPKDNWELIHEFVNKFGRIPKDEDELNVLIEYVLKRQRPTWGEEDERFLNVAINILNSSKVYTKSPDKYEDTINWFKSFKGRYTWKPSNEQLRELHCVISGCSFETPILVRLEEQLKKL